MGVYRGWDNFLLNMVVKFFLKKYLLYDFLLSDGGEVFLERRGIFSVPCLPESWGFHDKYVNGRALPAGPRGFQST
jgi:hypothetical protein